MSRRFFGQQEVCFERGGAEVRCWEDLWGYPTLAEAEASVRRVADGHRRRTGAHWTGRFRVVERHGEITDIRANRDD